VAPGSGHRGGETERRGAPDHLRIASQVSACPPWPALSPPEVVSAPGHLRVALDRSVHAAWPTLSPPEGWSGARPPQDCLDRCTPPPLALPLLAASLFSAQGQLWASLPLVPVCALSASKKRRGIAAHPSHCPSCLCRRSLPPTSISRRRTLWAFCKGTRVLQRTLYHATLFLSNFYKASRTIHSAMRQSGPPCPRVTVSLCR